MAWRNLERATFEHLLECFRQEVNFARAARSAGVSVPTAKRAYYTGWPRHPWAKPIQRLLEDEKTAARAALQREEEAKRKASANAAEDARKQALESYVEEGKLVRIARSFMGRAALPLDKLLTMAPQLVDIVSNALIVGKVDPVEAMRYLAMIEKLTTGWAEGLHGLMQMERLHLGKPEQIIGLTSDAPLTRDEAARKIEAAKTALERLRAKGMTVVDGGA